MSKCLLSPHPWTITLVPHSFNERVPAFFERKRRNIEWKWLTTFDHRKNYEDAARCYREALNIFDKMSKSCGISRLVSLKMILSMIINFSLHSNILQIVASSYTDFHDYTYYFVPVPWLYVKIFHFFFFNIIPYIM